MPLDINAVKKIMIKKNINNADLAEKMNVTPGRVSKLLNNNVSSYRINTIHSLASALDVEADEILKED
ncbi:MAG: helix-turn-helix transcriptional regulator [Clostridium butyricum]|nr:helix-turn-helix transcriptional regulator [Clostridium butyricum]MDU3594678.1 helix-turn-helix transcriptional regulator [Clostridium butyricum]